MSASPSGWRKVFIIPMVLGTYFWGTILRDELMKESAGMTGEVNVAEMIVVLPATLLQKMALHTISRAVLAEYFFLNCFGFFLMSLLFYKRRGASAYIGASYLTNGFIGLGLCNYLYPMTSLEYQYAEQQQETVKRGKVPAKVQPKGSKKSSSATPPPQLMQKKEGEVQIHTGEIPAVNHWVFLGLVMFVLVAGRAIIKGSKRDMASACMYAPVVYLTVPVVLLAANAKIQKITLDPSKVRTLLLFWAILGIVVAWHTRMGNAFFVRKLDFTSSKDFTESATRLFLQTKGLPRVYLAFAAQLGSFCVAVSLFTLFGGTTSFLVRLFLVPFHFLIPTVSIPLYFLVHDFVDHRMLEVEEEVLKRKAKKQE